MYDASPDLFSDLQLVWDAYQELALSRRWTSNGQPSGLSHTEIATWLDLNLINDPIYRFELYRYIKSMDISWLAIRQKKPTKPRGNTTSSNRRSQRKRRR